ncbi:hypothetical protein [Rhodothermus profundi]|uniref:Hpr(Ser) kinase/phosphatase n=1 Tax=Rhodothermus profundi TaxID=633813 RepID=A0A1M6VC42_9BACT|nr:hypothetical protein [Rhodothermus profundi]SHK79062.1 Hpr(Ser) kinase/phosphatase [Rhodothermus profundi]
MPNNPSSAVASERTADSGQKWPYHYSIYGLHLCSEIPLPELRAAQPAPGEIFVYRANLKPLARGLKRVGNRLRVTPSEALLIYDQVGLLRIEEGRRITFDVPEDLPAETLRVLILGIGLGILMHQRGHLVLHASAVAMGERVVAFIAEKGYGKSTMAAALHARGYQLVTDDVLVLDEQSDGPPLVLPSYPQLKLWPDALAQAMHTMPDGLPRVHPAIDKRVTRVPQSVDRPLPLAALFALRPGETIQIRPLSGQEAFLELLLHTYTRVLLEQTRTLARHLQQVGYLTRYVPVMALERPPGLELLPDVVAAIEAFMQQERA